MDYVSIQQPLGWLALEHGSKCARPGVPQCLDSHLLETGVEMWRCFETRILGFKAGSASWLVIKSKRGLSFFIFKMGTLKSLPLRVGRRLNGATVEQRS